MKALLVTSIFLLTSTILPAQGPATWSQSTAYTHPALVINGTTTYISIEDVPANTAITNTTYWATLDSLVPTDSPSGADSLTAPDASEVENLTVPDSTSSQNAKIVSVNVRGTIGAGNDKRIMGFRVNGSASVLLRGVGPTLADYGLPTTSLLPDPMITLYRYIDGDPSKGSERVTSGDNDNHTSNSNSSSIDSVRTSLNPVIATSSVQAISMPTLDAGFYTSQVEDVNGQTGIGWAGVDLSDPDGTSSAFLHVSARGLVQTTEFMFGGFQITGTGTRKVFIRGRGPSLAEVGVTGTMPDPKIKVFKYDTDPGGSSTEIADNDDYITQVSDKSADVSSIQSYSTSLYGWPVINDKGAALLMDLGPGYYTVQLISESSSNDGVGWIGIDDVTDQ
jgi:hypothetical protein